MMKKTLFTITVIFSLLIIIQSVNAQPQNCGSIGQLCCDGVRCDSGLECKAGICEIPTLTTTCQVKKQGCYKKDDPNPQPGGLSPTEFDFYLPQDKCLSDNACVCPSGSSATVSEQTDTDSSNTACECLSVSNWNTQSKCCGDDSTDCGIVISGNLCSMDANIPNTQSANWLTASTNNGDIRYVGCSNAEYLSDGTAWTRCDGTFWKKTVENSEYICSGIGKESIVECCGDGSCVSKTDGKKLSTGQSIIAADGKTYYCKSDRKFAADLDTTNTKSTCEKAGFKWTGTRCCSEDDDNLTSSTQREYYNDVGGSGGCWNSSIVISVDLVKGTNESVINYNGEFHGCAIEKGNFNKENDNLLTLRDKFTNNILITNHGYCFNDPDKNYYCAYKEKWLPTEGNDKSHLSYIPPKVLSTPLYTSTGTPYFTFSPNNGIMIANRDAWKFTLNNAKPGDALSVNAVKDGRDIGNIPICTVPSGSSSCNQVNVPQDKDIGKWVEKVLINGIEKGTIGIEVKPSPESQELIAECCAQTECWSGSSCLSNQRGNPLSPPLSNSNFRCIDGEWIFSSLKFTPDGDKSGYCAKETQCLLDPLAKEEKDQCVGSGNFTLDNFCSNGIWSSRTALLALELLKLKSGDYRLFCDNKENTLNYLQYQVDGKLVSAILENELKANNFCVLSTRSSVVLATSLNQENVQANNLKIFGVTSCNALQLDNGRYNSCDSTNKLWFNKRLQSLIYSQNPITITQEQLSFEEFVQSPIKNIIDNIKRLIAPPPYDESYVTAIKRFDKLYMALQGSKSIKGSIYGKSFNNAVIEYSGFSNDVCKFIEQYNNAKKDGSSGILCKKEGTNYYVLGQGSQFTNLNPELIWNDLTSKLRIK